MHPLLRFLIAPPLEENLERLTAAVSEKTVLITGASFGIGEATAQLLASAGATVLLLARTTEKLESLVHTISSSGGTAFAYSVDLSKLEDIKSIMAQIQLEHPQIDIVICNAGKSTRRKITDSFLRNDLERLIALNFSSPSSMLLCLLPRMLEQGGGQIINVSTVSAKLPGVPMWAAYQSSKTGFDLWLRAVANELRPQKILVSSIYMPLVRTRMSSAHQFANAPALTPLEAAQTIAYAIVKRVPRVAPWWLRWAELGAVILEYPVQLLLTWLFRYSVSRAEKNT